MTTNLFKRMNKDTQSARVYEPRSDFLQRAFRRVAPLVYRKSELTREQRFIERLFIGADYIYQKFGTEFDDFAIVDSGITHYSWNIPRKKGTLVVSSSDADLLGKAGRIFTGSKYHPHFVTGREAAVLLGVEEAYHQHQLRTNPEKYMPFFLANERMGRKDQVGVVDVELLSPELRRQFTYNPLENDAEVIVREAALEFGFWR